MTRRPSYGWYSICSRSPVYAWRFCQPYTSNTSCGMIRRILSRLLANFGLPWKWRCVPAQTIERCWSYWISSKLPIKKQCHRRGVNVNHALLVIIWHVPDLWMITSTTFLGVSRRLTRFLLVFVWRRLVSSQMTFNVGGYTRKRSWSGRCMTTSGISILLIIVGMGNSARGLRELINKTSRQVASMVPCLVQSHHRLLMTLPRHAASSRMRES